MTTSTTSAPAPVYYVSECPDTGRQFLVEQGRSGNIIELTPVMVQTLATVPDAVLHAAPDLLEACKQLLKDFEASDDPDAYGNSIGVSLALDVIAEAEGSSPES